MMSHNLVAPPRIDRQSSVKNRNEQFDIVRKASMQHRSIMIDSNDQGKLLFTVEKYVTDVVNAIFKLTPSTRCYTTVSGCTYATL